LHTLRPRLCYDGVDVETGLEVLHIFNGNSKLSPTMAVATEWVLRAKPFDDYDSGNKWVEDHAGRE
jgi:hypothetical protein